MTPSLTDEDLIAQQLPALRAVLPQLDDAADDPGNAANTSDKEFFF